MSFLRRLASKAPPWLQSLLVATLGVWVVYVVAANVILKTSLLRGWLRADDGSLAVDYTSARSLFPGSVVVHGLAIRFQDDVVQMGIGLDRVSVQLDLWQLAVHHTARFDHARGEGLDYRLRLKLDRVAGNERRLAAFPPIDGFPEPPIAQPPKPSTGRPWTIDIRDLESSVRAVWTMEWRFQGDATVTGGCHIAPRRQVYVTTSTLRTRSGTLGVAGEDLLRGGDWQITADIAPFVPQETDGVDILRYISFAIRQKGEVVSLGGLGNAYLPPGLSLDGGAGTLGIDVHVDRGIVQPDARITYRTPAVELRSPGLGGAGDLDFVAHVIAGGAPHVAAEARIAHGTLSPATELSALHGELELGGVDTTAPIVLARLAGAVGAARIADLRAWKAIAPAAVRFDGGAVTTTAHAEYRDGALTGHVASTLEKVAMTVDPFAFVASGKTSTDVTSSDVHRDIHLRDTHADLDNMAVKLLDGHAEHMWLRARADDTRIATSGATATDTAIGVVSGPGDQNLKLFTRMASIPDLAADITHGEVLSAQVRLHVRHDEIAIDVVTSKNGILGARGTLHAPSKGGINGALLLSVGPINAGLHFHNGKVSIHPLASGEWLDETLAKR